MGNNWKFPRLELNRSTIVILCRYQRTFTDKYLQLILDKKSKNVSCNKVVWWLENTGSYCKVKIVKLANERLENEQILSISGALYGKL